MLRQEPKQFKVKHLITSVRVADGAYMDGNYTKEMLAQAQKSGMKIEKINGDRAYFRKPILEEIKAIEDKLSYLIVQPYTVSIKRNSHTTKTPTNGCFSLNFYVLFKITSKKLHLFTSLGQSPWFIKRLNLKKS